MVLVKWAEIIRKTASAADFIPMDMKQFKSNAGQWFVAVYYPKDYPNVTIENMVKENIGVENDVDLYTKIKPEDMTINFFNSAKIV